MAEKEKFWKQIRGKPGIKRKTGQSKHYRNDQASANLTRGKLKRKMPGGNIDWERGKTC